MIRLLIPALAIVCPVAVHAQSITGSVKAADDKPVLAATVTLLKAVDSSWVKTTITDSTGHFSLEAQPGNYVLKVQASGMQSLLQSCEVKDQAANEVQLVLLPAQATDLKEVVITSQKPFIEARPGMMVVNVEGSPAAAGNNALDLLQRSPGVRVDPQGNIALKGREGVQVYIDGRPSRLSGEQLTAYLKGMTADEIAALELITQPSAKYDAAGNAGIINIRTRRTKKHGLNSSFSGTYAHTIYPNATTSSQLTYRHNKLTVYGSHYFNFADNALQLKTDRKFRENGGDEITDRFLLDNKQRFTSRFHRFKAGAEYAVGKKTTIGIRGVAPIGYPTIKADMLTTIQDLRNASTSYTHSGTYNNNHWNEQEIGLQERHEFEDGSALSFDGYLVSNHSNDRQTMTNQNEDALRRPVGDAEVWKNRFPVAIRVVSGQTDYNRTPGEKTKLEAGLKYSNIRIDNIADYEVLRNASFVFDSLRSTHFQYQETIAAAYGSISRTVNSKLDVQAGLRAEQTISKGELPRTAQHFDRQYLSLFPTAYAQYKVDSLNSITFSYGRRLDRPQYYQMNPSRSYNDRYTYNTGNPRLLPQFSNNLELSHSYKSQFTTTASYAVVRNVITDLFIQNDATKETYQDYRNIATYQQAGISMSYNHTILPGWTLSIYGDWYWKQYTGDYNGQPIFRTGNGFTTNTTSQLALGKRWNAELTAWYVGPNISTVFTRDSAMYGVNGGLSRKLLSDSLIIKLAVNDAFYSSIYRGSNRFANFDYDVYNRWGTRRVALSASYTLGKDKIDLLRRKNEDARKM